MDASARLILCAPKHCHITPLLQQLHWLPIRLRIEFKILLIIFKLLHGSAPKYLIDLISVLPPSHYDLWRNNQGILLSTSKRFTEVTMGDRSFMAAAPRLWNSLPVSIRSACTTSDFEQKVEKFLFSQAFCQNNKYIFRFLYSFLRITFLIANCKQCIYCNVCSAHLIIFLENAQYES